MSEVLFAASGSPEPVTTQFDPDYVNANNSSRIVGVVGAFHVLALIFVGLRSYVRLRIVRSFGIDDALVFVAAGLALGAWTCLFLQIPYGLGRHGAVIPPEDRSKMERINFWKTVWSDGVALGVLRISIAISLLRLNKDMKWYRYSLFAIIGFVVLYTLQAIIWLFVYCTPYSGWWEFQWMNPFDPRCHDFNLFLNLTYWNVACNIFTDVMLGALPVRIIWNLQMKFRVRLYAVVILNLGYFAVLMGILKAVFMLTTGGDPDQTFNLWVHFWQNLQLNIGIIAACASFLRPLFGRFLKLNSTAAKYRSGTSNNARTKPTLATIGSSGFGTRRYGKSRNMIEDELEPDHFEMHTRSPDSATAETSKQSVDEDDQSTRFEKGQGEAYTYGVMSASQSDERILPQSESARGIVLTRDVRVQYSSS